MAISLTIDLSDRDLGHFNQSMEQAKAAAAHKTPQDVIAATGALLADAQKVHLPGFIRERDSGIGYGSSSGCRGKANDTRAWRPSLYKFG